MYCTHYLNSEKKLVAFIFLTCFPVISNSITSHILTILSPVGISGKPFIFIIIQHYINIYSFRSITFTIVTQIELIHHLIFSFFKHYSDLRYSLCALKAVMFIIKLEGMSVFVCSLSTDTKLFKIDLNKH